MADNVMKLVGVLERLLRAHKRLLELSLQQKTTLISGDIAKLDRVVQQMAESVRQISELEEARHQAATLLADELQLRDEATASTIANNVGSHRSKADLIRLTESLKAVLAELDVVNRQNSSLTQQSLSYMGKSIELLASLASSPMYAKHNRKEGYVGAQFFSVQT